MQHASLMQADAVIPPDPWRAFIDRGSIKRSFTASAADPLSGVRLAVKNNIAVSGYRLTDGLETNARATTRSAPCVERLAEAGAVIVGTANLAPLAFGVDTVSPVGGRTLNPMNPNLIAGGSSGGSAAAVAADLADVALGTDTGGSVRVPAACCGIWGFKPTFDAISMDGITPLASTLDHVGLLAKDPRSLQAVLNISAPHLFGDTPQKGALTRLILPRYEGGFWLNEDIQARWAALCEQLARADLVIASTALPEFAEMQSTIIHFEAARAHATLIGSLQEGLDVKDRLRRGMAISEESHRRALAGRDQLRDDIRHLLGEQAAIAMPTLPVAVPQVGASVSTASRPLSMPSALTALTSLANLTGFPAISFPVAISEAYPRFSMQLIGPHHRDAALLDLAMRLASHLSNPTIKKDETP